MHSCDALFFKRKTSELDVDVSKIQGEYKNCESERKLLDFHLI